MSQIPKSTITSKGVLYPYSGSGNTAFQSTPSDDGPSKKLSTIEIDCSLMYPRKEAHTRKGRRVVSRGMVLVTGAMYETGTFKF